MRSLQKLEIVLAWLMPCLVLLPIIWTLGVFLAAGKQVFQALPVFLDSRLIPLYLVTIFAPVIGYSILGLIASFAALRNSKLLTGIYCIAIVPLLVLSGYLMLVSFVFGGPWALLIQTAPPLLALLLVPVSLTARFASDIPEPIIVLTI